MRASTLQPELSGSGAYKFNSISNSITPPQGTCMPGACPPNDSFNDMPSHHLSQASGQASPLSPLSPEASLSNAALLSPTMITAATKKKGLFSGLKSELKSLFHGSSAAGRAATGAGESAAARPVPGSTDGTAFIEAKPGSRGGRAVVSLRVQVASSRDLAGVLTSPTALSPAHHPPGSPASPMPPSALFASHLRPNSGGSIDDPSLRGGSCHAANAHAAPGSPFTTGAARLGASALGPHALQHGPSLHMPTHGPTQGPAHGRYPVGGSVHGPRGAGGAAAARASALPVAALSGGALPRCISGMSVAQLNALLHRSEEVAGGGEGERGRGAAPSAGCGAGGGGGRAPPVQQLGGMGGGGGGGGDGSATKLPQLAALQRQEAPAAAAAPAPQRAGEREAASPVGAGEGAGGGEGPPTTRLLALNPALPAGMRRRNWCLEDYQVAKRMYKGSTSAVYKAACLRSGQAVALKVYFLSRVPANVVHMVRREVELHAGLVHRAVVQLYAAFQDDKHIVLVQEYAARGDLFGIHRSMNCRLTETQVTELVLAPFLDALAHLHARGIMHRDIKPENILFTADWALKVADFGVSINVHEERAVTRTGTSDYMAPEVERCPLKHAPEDNKDVPGLAYTTAIDIWSVGVLTYELLVGFPPFVAAHAQEEGGAGGGGTRAGVAAFMAEQATRKTLRFPASTSAAARDFILAALAEAPGDRPTAQQLQKHPWLFKAARRPSINTTTSRLSHTNLSRLE